MINDCRLGKFYIKRRDFENPHIPLHDIFRELAFVPVRCEMSYEMDAIEYLGYSPLFDEVKPGEMARVYDVKPTVTWRADNDGGYSEHITLEVS